MAGFTEAAIRFINQCGFPIYVAIMLLIQQTRQHEQNQKLLTELIHTVSQLKRCIELKHPETGD